MKVHVNLTSTVFDEALRVHAAQRSPGDELLDYTGSVQRSHPSPRRAVLEAVRRAEKAFFYVDDLALSPLDRVAALKLLAPSRRVELADLEGRVRPLSLVRAGLAVAQRLLYVSFLRPLVRFREENACRRIFAELETVRPVSLGVRPRRIAYLRTDLLPIVRAGGSIAHISGVANALQEEGVQVRLYSTAKIPTVRAETTVVAVPGDLADRLPGREEVVLSQRFARAVEKEVRAFSPDLLYWRHSRAGLAGALLSQRLTIPYVLEFNGSEVFASEKWAGEGTLPFRDLMIRAENIAFHLARRIVVVSDVLKDDLAARGVSPQKILVEPNGVDMDRFPRESLDLVRDAVRTKLGFRKDDVVCGFIGTFGKWHGAQLLAKAVKPAVERFPALRFLVIGDGQLMPEVRATLERDKVEERVVLTGLVPQPEAPALLNACDLYASPHVPNEDGSRFFGSPTKIFEYMALGRGIVSSSLGQLGEVLKDGETARLVPPGDLERLVSGIVELAKDPELRERLGRAARARVLERHTWRANVRSLLASLP